MEFVSRAQLLPNDCNINLFMANIIFEKQIDCLKPFQFLDKSMPILISNQNQNQITES